MAEDDRDDDLAPVRVESALSMPQQPAMLTADAFVQGLRELRHRIPEFTQLSLREKQSLARVAHLDPELVDAGIQAATVWTHMRQSTGETGEELQSQLEEIQAWDLVEEELKIVLKGISAANLKRKQRLGRRILQVYALIEAILRDQEDAYLRPYFEKMKKLFTRKRGAKT